MGNQGIGVGRVMTGAGDDAEHSDEEERRS
jgi:hypothetical protein